MKKKAMVLCLALVALVAVSSHAQNKSSSLIIKGGVNFANVSINGNGDVDDAKSITSFQAGIVGDIHLASILYLQPGVLFTGKGTKTQVGDEGSANWYRAKSNPYYVEVPVNLVLKTPGATRFFVGAGPYLGIGVAGKNKVEGAVAGVGFESDENIKFSNDDPTTLGTEEGSGFGIMKRFDYGLNGLAGIEFSNMTLGVNYGLGLAKLQSGQGSGDDRNNKHRVFSVTLGLKL